MRATIIKLKAAAVVRPHASNSLRNDRREFAFHGLGNALAPAWRKSPPLLLRVGVFAAIAVYTLVALPHIPFSSGTPLAVLASALILAPAAIFTGLFLPWGLSRAPATVGRNLFWDGAGTAFGFLAFLLCTLAFGLSSSLWLTGGCYLSATLLGGYLS